MIGTAAKADLVFGRLPFNSSTRPSMTKGLRLPAQGPPDRSANPEHRRSRTRTLVLFSATMLVAVTSALAVQTSELERDGPWVFTERIVDNEAPHAYMAATPAAEDADVWLLLVCNAGRVTASVMFSLEPSYSVRSPPQLILRSDMFPIVSVLAQAVQKSQLSIDAGTTRHLMPLFTDGEKLVISIRDSSRAMHEYTFSLQPNASALAGIERHCMDADK